MVEIINKTVTRGVAGRRPGAVKGVVSTIHGATQPPNKKLIV